MPAALHHLARHYRASAAGRSPDAARDFTIDYESFLHRARADDGDARELAERELIGAAAASNGLLRVERHPKSGIPTVLRLTRDGGEDWLFQTIGEPSPRQQRRELAGFFDRAAATAVPDRWRESWCHWLANLSSHALAGRSVQPFRRDDPDGNTRLLAAIAGVLNWREPALVRYASAAITGDSKQLQSLEPRIRPALAAITGHTTLEAFGIHPKPRFVTLHGPLTLTYDGAPVDCARFPAPIALAEPVLARANSLTTTARLCLTVENEDTFHALANANPPDVLLVLTSYAGSAVRTLLASLPENLPIRHFGDADPAGCDILRDLREKSGRDIQALAIPRPAGPSPAAAPPSVKPFTPADQRLLRRLLDSDLPDATRDHLAALRDTGGLRDFEQEHIPIPIVLEAIRRCHQPNRVPGGLP